MTKIARRKARYVPFAGLWKAVKTTSLPFPRRGLAKTFTETIVIITEKILSIPEMLRPGMKTGFAPSLQCPGKTGLNYTKTITTDTHYYIYAWERK